MKRATWTLVAFLVISTPAYAEAPSFQAATANIVGWNLAGFNAIPRDKAETFANAIADIDGRAARDFACETDGASSGALPGRAALRANDAIPDRRPTSNCAP